jgi:hypothetical protein
MLTLPEIQARKTVYKGNYAHTLQTTYASIPSIVTHTTIKRGLTAHTTPYLHQLAILLTENYKMMWEYNSIIIGHWCWWNSRRIYRQIRVRCVHLSATITTVSRLNYWKPHVLFRTTLASCTLCAVGRAIQALLPQVLTTYFYRVITNMLIDVISYSSTTSSSRFWTTILYI